MKKHKKYIINWLVVAVVCLVYITLTPPTDTIKELIATWFIGFTVMGIGFYFDRFFEHDKKDNMDFEDKEYF